MPPPLRRSLAGLLALALALAAAALALRRRPAPAPGAWQPLER